MNDTKYEVHVKDHRGSSLHGSYEICVVRSDNHHGKSSYGWPSVNKIILFGSGTGEGRCDQSESEFAFGIQSAELLCHALNATIKLPKVTGGGWVPRFTCCKCDTECEGEFAEVDFQQLCPLCAPPQETKDNDQ